MFPSGALNSGHARHYRATRSAWSGEEELLETSTRGDHCYVKKLAWAGGITAPTRTGESGPIPTGHPHTCMPDAVFSGLNILEPDHNCTLAQLRGLACPALGNNRSASWYSMATALSQLECSYQLHECTRDFKVTGGPGLNLLKAPNGVYITSLYVTANATNHKHCIVVSTVPEVHCPRGKLIDNHRLSKPVYLQSADVKGKRSAKRVFKQLLDQRKQGSLDITGVDIAEVYRLQRC